MINSIFVTQTPSFSVQSFVTKMAWCLNVQYKFQKLIEGKIDSVTDLNGLGIHWSVNSF